MKCPNCGSKNIVKEVMLGQKTGDRICTDCKYAGPREDFETKDKK